MISLYGEIFEGNPFCLKIQAKRIPFFCAKKYLRQAMCTPFYPFKSNYSPPFWGGLGVRLLGVRLFLYPSCLKDFLFGIVDFLELAFGSPFDIVAKGGYTVGMMLESKLAVGSLDLLVGG